MTWIMCGPRIPPQSDAHVVTRDVKHNGPRGKLREAVREANFERQTRSSPLGPLSTDLGKLANSEFAARTTDLAYPRGKLGSESDSEFIAMPSSVPLGRTTIMRVVKSGRGSSLVRIHHCNNSLFSGRLACPTRKAVTITVPRT